MYINWMGFCFSWERGGSYNTYSEAWYWVFASITLSLLVEPENISSFLSGDGADAAFSVSTVKASGRKSLVLDFFKKSTCSLTLDYELSETLFLVFVFF